MKPRALKAEVDTAGLVGMGLITTCALLRCSPSVKLRAISASRSGSRKRHGSEQHAHAAYAESNAFAFKSS